MPQHAVNDLSFRVRLKEKLDELSTGRHEVTDDGMLHLVCVVILLVLLRLAPEHAVRLGRDIDLTRKAKETVAPQHRRGEEGLMCKLMSCCYRIEQFHTEIIIANQGQATSDRRAA